MRREDSRMRGREGEMKVRREREKKVGKEREIGESKCEEKSYNFRFLPPWSVLLELFEENISVFSPSFFSSFSSSSFLSKFLFLYPSLFLISSFSTPFLLFMFFPTHPPFFHHPNSFSLYFQIYSSLTLSFHGLFFSFHNH